MRHILFPLAAFVVPLAAQAAPPQLVLQAAVFRSLDQAQHPGGEVDVYVTVPVRPLTYRMRAPRSYQASAVVDLSIVRNDGQAVWQETVTLKPPILTDTTVSIKPPLSFLKRVNLPDGTYTLRGKVRDQYKSANGETTVEQPLTVAPAAGPAFSDVVLLSQPAAKAGGDNLLNRGGYLLTRAPGNFYGRGADNVFFYTELTQLPAGRPVVLHYHLENAEGFAADADADPIKPAAGRPTTIVGQLPLGPLPSGAFTLTIEARDAATKKPLAKVSQPGARSTTEYAPAGAALPK